MPSPITTSTKPFIEPNTDWMRRGHCVGDDPDIYFPDYDGPSSAIKAKAVCERCPVRVECLTLALATDERGIWGGTTEAERRAIKRPSRRAVCIFCRSDRLDRPIDDDKSEICLDCGMSWRL